MLIPESLQPYIEKAKDLSIGEIEFSGTTYQIQVLDKDEREDVWAFIQLDKKNELKDAFCSCEQKDDGLSCPHIAAAFLRIFNGHEKPLHTRFSISLWNKLCKLYSDRVGDSIDHLTPDGQGNFELSSTGKKNLFYIKGKSKAAIHKLEELLLNRHFQTEETSLKFSNLSQEEILLWREGKPTDDLRYELSFWNDLAKWFKTMQEEGVPYTLSFDYSKREIPNYIQVKFKELEAGFYLSEANLPLIIPALATVLSPLKVHKKYEESVEKITYDKFLKSFKVEALSIKKNNVIKEQKGEIIGDWLFVKNDGFYLLHNQKSILNPIIEKNQIASFLKENFYIVKERLEGTLLHQEKVTPSYSLSFDGDWNLHISSYLFSEGDLAKPYSQDFGDWAYLDDDGFYKIENRAFKLKELIIKRDDVADFARKERSFLNAQEGFKVSLASIEAELSFALSKDGKLTFARRTASYEKDVEMHDFGSIIYLAGLGFFTKISSPIGLPVRPDIAILPGQIPLFIRMNKSDLSHVPGFFSERSPVLKAGLKVFLTDEKTVKIAPLYDLEKGFENKNIRFFDDFCFVEDEGFHELPFDSRLPEEYRYPVEIEKDRLSLFLSYELIKLLPYVREIDDALIAPKKMQLKALKIERAENIGKGFYNLKLAIETERGLISIYEIWNAIKKKKPYHFDKSGLIDLSSKYFDWVRLLDKGRVDKKHHTIILSTLELIRLNAFYEIQVKEVNGTDSKESLELLKELIEFKSIDDPDLFGLNSTLRPYQQIGVNWLWFLYHHGLSGLLSDDMGLGKTHQTMALMAAVMNAHKKQGSLKKHFLIICPTSVIYHWQEKLQAFLPSAKICTFHGQNRSLKEFQQEYDILLTSYGIWRLEHEFISKFPFEIAIFDEVQVAKNHNSRLYSSLTYVNAEMRIGLTGTPIENHLRELKALFDVVVPTYMPPESDFREFFVKPIEKEQNKEKKELLSRFIKPFLLRRKKSQVLLDLPEKIEEVAHTELAPSQAKLYNDTIEKNRAKILESLQDQNEPVPYMHIFALLSALKQICNHPAVFYKDPSNYQQHASGKWDLFVELLSEALESEQKVVVFSQYLFMLDIMEDYLNENGVGFATIRGSTKNRGEQIHRFNHDPECRVFLGSLQASGLGLDLTAGSVVIHYDRWWNAARENQATDRVHRIGQTRGVQVFKLVTKGTLEEGIDQLIFKKGQLMEDIITVDDHQIIKKFTREEITSLLQYSRLSF